MQARLVIKRETADVTTSPHALQISQAALWLLSRQHEPAARLEVEEGRVVIPEDARYLQKQVAIGSDSRQILPPSRLALLASEHYPTFADLCFKETLTAGSVDEHARALMAGAAGSPPFGKNWVFPRKLRLAIGHKAVENRLAEYLRDHGDDLTRWTTHEHQEAADKTLEDMIGILEASPKVEPVVSDETPSVNSTLQDFDGIEADDHTGSQLFLCSGPIEKMSLIDQIKLNRMTTRQKLLKEPTVRGPLAASSTLKEGY